MIKKSMPIVKNDLIVFKKKLKNELLLRTKYSLDRTNFKLNACAKTFYELCDGEKTCEDIIKEMNRRFPDVPIDVIERDFEKTLKELHKRGIIGWKNGINAFADEMEDKINKSVSYCTCDYNTTNNCLTILRGEQKDIHKFDRVKISCIVHYSLFYSCGDKINMCRIFCIIQA